MDTAKPKMGNTHWLIRELTALRRGVWAKKLLIPDDVKADWYRQGYEDAMSDAIARIVREKVS